MLSTIRSLSKDPFQFFLLPCKLKCEKTLLNHGLPGGWGRGTFSTPPERGTFFRLQVYIYIYERAGLLLAEAHERVEKPVISVCKKAQKVLQEHFKRSGLVIYSYFENGAFTAVKTWMQSSK